MNNKVKDNKILTDKLTKNDSKFIIDVSKIKPVNKNDSILNRRIFKD